MPELPEVETVRLQLQHKILGKTIAKVEVFRDKSVAHNPNLEKQIKGLSFGKIDRIGKLLIFSFQKETDVFLLAHLRMTGQFFYKDKNEIIGGGHSATELDSKNLPNKHTRVAIYFTDSSALFFNDMRLFGYLMVADAAGVSLAKAKFGPEPTDLNFDTSKFIESLKKKKSSIKAVLLDQSFIAGLGNIYVDEALHKAKVRPDRAANMLTKKEATALAKASGDIMNKSITVGGTTFQHFKDTDGNKGNYTQHLKVFGKQNTACSICGTTIKKTKVAGRGTHFCPKCQK